MSDFTDDGAVVWRVARGMHVYDAKGERMGVVAELDTKDDGFVEEGHFLPGVVPVPMSAVSSVNGDGVHLIVCKEDAAIGNWHDVGTDATGAQTHIDTETPYRADGAESVSDRDLNIDQPSTNI